MFRNLLSLLVADLTTRVLGIVATVYLGRQLGDDGFGLLNFAFAVASYFLMPVNFGFNEYGVLQVSPDRSTTSIRRQLGLLFGLRSVIAVVAFAALVICSFAVPRFHSMQPMLLLAGTMVLAYALSTEWLFTAVERMSLIAVARIASSLLYFGLLFLFIRSADDLLMAAGLQAGRHALLVLILLLLCARKLSRLSMTFDRAAWREIGVYVLPIGLAAALSRMHSNVDLVLLGFLVEDDALGWYAAALHLIGAARTLKMTMGQVILPRLASRRGQRADMLALGQKLQRYVSVLGVMIAVGGSTLGPELIAASYGAEFANAALPLQIGVWTVFFELVGLVYTNILFIRNRHRFAAFYGISLAVNIAANLALIPSFHIAGSAVAFVLSNGVWIALCYRAVRLDDFLIPVFPPLAKPLVAGILMALAALMLRPYGFWVAGFGSVVLYSSVLFVMGFTPARIKADLQR